MQTVTLDWIRESLNAGEPVEELFYLYKKKVETEKQQNANDGEPPSPSSKKVSQILISHLFYLELKAFNCFINPSFGRIHSLLLLTKLNASSYVILTQVIKYAMTIILERDTPALQ